MTSGSATRIVPRTIGRTIPRHLVFFGSVYATGIMAFTLFRTVLLIVERAQASDVPTSVMLEAMFMGFRFDTVVSGYILALPLLLLSVAAAVGHQPRWLHTATLHYLASLYSVAFLICAADIPFYDHFLSRLTITALAWTDTPGFMVAMIAQDPTYYPYMLLLTGVCAFFIVLLRSLRTRILDRPRGERPRGRRLAATILLSLTAMLVMFIGIRGRVAGKSPIRWGTAFFSTYAFPNQLGLNPVFTFVRSYIDSKSSRSRTLTLMDDTTAISNARHYLNVAPGSGFDSPIARMVHPDGKPLRANVVLVIMESMGASRMGRYGDPDSLTPHLDAIARNSIVFDNIYTAGIHTYNGIYASLFSFPALWNQHPMISTNALQPFTGIGRTLADNGYATAFFTTHDEQFDNMGGFMSFNGFQTIVGQKDYPSNRVLSTLGVPDHYMFEYSIPILDTMSGEGKPFFAAFMTGSYHGPYIVPKDIPFRPRPNELKKQVEEYADWSIGHLLDLCSRRPWFRNTIFVFVADHGGSNGSVYDMSLELNHTPLIIHAPGLIGEPRRYGAPGGQIDLYPTVMGLLNLPYINNTMGIDLLRDRRPFIYFGADDKIGVLNDEYFLVVRREGGESLYHYTNHDRMDIRADHAALVDSMKTYAYSMLQTTQWMISNRKVGPQSMPTTSGTR